MFDNITIMPLTHFIYLAIGIGVTIWVAHTLRMHGRVFLARGCKGNDELASSLSHLLTTGFYLLHVGCLLLALRFGGTAHDATSAIELLSTKLGLVLVVLAISHFAHLGLYSKIHGKPKPFHPNVPSSANVVAAEMAKS